MELTITRPSKDSVVVDAAKFGTILVFQQVGKKDNKRVNDVLTQYFGTVPVNIYYDYKLVSVFIFDTGGKDLSKSDLNTLRSKLGGKQKYAVIQSGAVAKGNTLQQLNLQCSKDQITVNQKFTTLLAVKKAKPVEEAAS